MIKCPIAIAHRTAFIDGLFITLEQNIPNDSVRRTVEQGGMSLGDSSYTQGSATGTVTVAVSAVGGDLLIGVTLRDGQRPSP